MEKVVMTVNEVAKVLGIARPNAYELVKRADFPAIRIGERRIVIPVEEFKCWLTSASKQG